MGLFSGSKTITVSSVAYNLAGPLGERPDYLTTTAVQAVLSNDPGSVSDRVVESQIQGPTIDQRAFFRWAKANYPEGRCTGRIGTAKTIRDGTSEMADVKAAMIAAGLVPAGRTLWVQSAVVDSVDVSYWAERYILRNRPDQYPLDWVATFNFITKTMTITYPDASTTLEVIPNFPTQTGRRLVVAYYSLLDGDDVVAQRVWIYIQGTSSNPGAYPALDGLSATLPQSLRNQPEFYPVIPLRLKNVSIADPSYASQYPKHEKAYRKSTSGGRFDELVADVDENEEIDEIDHAFLVHGVELNTQEPAGLKYLYQFFRELMGSQASSAAEVEAWILAIQAQQSGQDPQEVWEEAQAYPGDPLYGTPRPATTARYSPPTLSSIEVATQPSSPIDYRMRLSWLAITEEIVSGVGGKPRPDPSDPDGPPIFEPAQQGDLWWRSYSDVTLEGVRLYNGLTGGQVGLSDSTTFSHTALFWQDQADVYRRITIYGLVHENFVYLDKTVTIRAREALTDPEVTGFVVPMHYETLRSLPLKDSNQLSGSNRIIIFNCYQVVRRRWYQTGIFKILLPLVLAVVVSLVVPGGVGLLGANLAVGTSLGLTGTAALVAGAVANAVAAMVLTSLINTGARAVFGEKMGAIIGAIATFVAFQAVSAFSMSGNFALDWGQLMRVENLLQMTQAVSSGASAWAQVEMGEIGEEIAELGEDYAKSLDTIQKMWSEVLGAGGGVIDPLLFTQATDDVLSQARTPGRESSSTFLSRTLLTGSEISQISNDSVREYVSLSLRLPEPFE